MNILIIGGTRLIGKHLVEHLLNANNKYKITIANRGLTPDNFGDKVERIVLERTNAESMRKALDGKKYDIVYDSLAFCSNDVKYLLDVLDCGRYIMTSTVSVYQNYVKDMKETDFEPLEYPLKWLDRTDSDYAEIKRQAECALYQKYNHIPSVAVRIPFVIGEDDYTKRLHFYVELVKKSIPMTVNNLDEQLSFINSDEAGKFLAWLAENDFCGIINASAQGTVSLREIIRYAEEKTGVSALLSLDGKIAPYNSVPNFSMGLQKAEDLGFKFSDLDSWIFGLLDKLIVNS